MPCYVGLDMSKQLTAICVMDRDGSVLRESAVPTSPVDIINFLRGDGLRYARVGLEAGALAPWLYERLARAGLPVICIETRHAHSVLKANPNKTDRSDARGIADLMRTRTYRPVHVKTESSQRAQALVTARKFLKTKAQSISNLIRGLLLGLGLKVDKGKTATFARRVRLLISRHSFAQSLINPLLEAQSALYNQLKILERNIEETAKADPVCRLLTTAPGVGWLTSITFRATVDEPSRFTKSRTVGPHLGLVPRTFQSGETERRGRITKSGDTATRTALYMAAMSLMRMRRRSWLKDWGTAVAARRGAGKAIVAVARRLGVVLHRMWITGTPFRWENAAV